MNFIVTIIYMIDNARLLLHGNVLEFKREKNCLTSKEAIMIAVNDFDTYDNIIIAVTATKQSK